jgi:hypothetical protein
MVRKKDKIKMCFKIKNNLKKKLDKEKNKDEIVNKAFCVQEIQREIILGIDE